MKIGLIGYGYWGGGYVARNIARVADLAVIADPDPQRQVEAARIWAPWGTRIASEPSVAFEQCDGVWIAAPADQHEELVLHALMAGCHVLCEKPFVLSAQAAENLADIAEEHDKVLMVGHLSLYTAQHYQFKLWAEEKAALVLPNIRVNRLTDRMSLADHSVLWGLGPHDIASLVDCLGLPSQVVFSGNEHRVTGTLDWVSGAQATIVLDWLSNERLRTFKVGGGAVDFARCEETREPLLSEASEFAFLCQQSMEAGRRSVHRKLAVQVTQVLQQAEVSILEGALEKT